jgi:hypothetical protein
MQKIIKKYSQKLNKYQFLCSYLFDLSEKHFSILAHFSEGLNDLKFCTIYMKLNIIILKKYFKYRQIKKPQWSPFKFFVKIIHHSLLQYAKLLWRLFFCGLLFTNLPRIKDNMASQPDKIDFS